LVFFLADDYDVIDVDVEYPERNREVLIVGFTDVAKEGVLHNGFDIVVPAVDMRDYLTDKYKLELVSHNELLLTMPAVHAWNLANFDKFFKHQEKYNHLCLRLKQGHDVFHNSILSETKRLTKYLLLRFPKNCALSTRHYSEHKTELTCKIAPLLDVSFDWKNKKGIPQNTNVVYWKVSVKEFRERVVEKKTIDDSQTKGEKELSKLFSSMSFH
jgi:hypothetical protein